MTRSTSRPAAVDEAAARRFLAAGRLAVVGASGSKGNFGADVVRALRDHGIDVVTVHPSGAAVEDVPAHTDLAAVPGELAGVVVMVPGAAAADVVRACAARGVPRVWLFRGVGSPGAVSTEALEAAGAAGMDVVPGACPLMFLEPVGWAHRIHRIARRARGTLRAA